MYDIEQIKQRLSCVDVAQRCGLPITKSGDRCVSPLRAGASNPSSFVVDDEFWYDFGDGRGGDCIDLMAEIQFNGDRGSAIRELARLTGVVDNDPRPDGWLAYTQNLCNMVAHWQTRLTAEDRDYLHSRGLSDFTIESLRLGRTDDGRLSIPYIKNGYVAYYCTRYLPGGAYPDSKYRKQKRDDYCEHIVWGLDTLNRSEDILVIAEGAFDAMSFVQEGYPCISAITGSFSKDQMPTVLAAARKFKKVLIVYDNDAKSHAGEKFTYRMANTLVKNRIPFIVGTVPAPYKDVSEYYAVGGDLSKIIDAAVDGTHYIAGTLHDFEELEKFIYMVARHTKRTKLESLFGYLRKTSDFDSKRLETLFKSATTAPPETMVADELMKKHKLLFIDSVGFYEYSGGVWQRRSDTFIKAYADKQYGEFSTAQRIGAICNLLKSRARQDVSFNQNPVWNFINGTLELDTGKFRDHNPNDYCSFQASYPYNPDATYSSWSQFIDDVTGGDPKSSELLQFIPAYVLFQSCPHEKIFVLTGSGGNGKSRYLEVLRQLFAPAVSHLKPRALLDKFQLITLRESFINLAGEIRSDLRDVEEAMKSISSGEPQSACFKGEQFVNFIPRTKLVYACNGQISSGDTSDGLARRLIIVDFKMKFVDIPDPEDPYQRRKDIHILDKLADELQSGGIFNWVYAGYKLLRTVGYFTETSDQAELISDFKRASNPVLLFYEDFIQPNMPEELQNKVLYWDYKQWCDDNGHKPMASNWFHREFRVVAERHYEAVRNSKSKGYKKKSWLLLDGEDYGHTVSGLFEED